MLAALCGCGTGQTGVEVSQTASGGVPGYAEAALRQAGRQFLGDGGQGIAAQAAPRARQSRASPPDFSPGASTPYDEEPGRITAIALVRHDRIGPLGLRSRLALGHDDKRVTLPEGLGILTDPMTVDLSANTLSVELAAVTQQEVGRGWQAEYAAGIGLLASDAEISLQSDLIALRSRSVTTAGFLTLGARLQQDSGLFWDGQMRAYQDRSTEFRSGVGFAF